LFIRELLSESEGITQKQICERLTQEFGISYRHGRTLCKTYKDDPEAIDLLPVKAAKVEQAYDVQALPHVKEEFDEWLKKNVTSYEARAMRIQKIIEVSNEGEGIAQMKALEKLDDIAAEHMDFEGESEIMFFRVTGPDGAVEEHEC